MADGLDALAQDKTFPESWRDLVALNAKHMCK
jgi:hypothetical protein